MGSQAKARSSLTRSSIYGASAALVCIVLQILIEFVVQKVFINSLGLDYLGVNALFGGLISLMGVAEIGIGSAIIYHLYRPFAENNHLQIRALLGFYKSAYKYIALAILGTGLAIMAFLPLLVKSNTAVHENIYVIFSFFIAEAVFSYLLAYKRSILYADRKNYLITIINFVGFTAVSLVQIYILTVTGDYLLFLLSRVAFRVAENLILTMITNRLYPYILEKPQPLATKIKRDIFQKVYALFFHKIGTFVVIGTDNVLISVIFGVKVVGLYSNYQLIIVSIVAIFERVFANVTSSIGNLLLGNKERTLEVYKNIQFINFIAATTISLLFLFCIQDFIRLWLGDDKFLLDSFAIVAFSVYIFLTVIRETPSIFKEAGGVFHQDCFIPLVESIVNVVASIILAHFFGLAGIFLGTIVSTMILHLYSYPKFVYSGLLLRPYAEYIQTFFIQLGVFAFLGVTEYLIVEGIRFDNLALTLLTKATLCLLMTLSVIGIVYYKKAEMKYVQRLIRRVCVAVRHFSFF